MRAVFSDSYEFTVNRHYTLNFISYFKKHRGYDITPYLPANMQRLQLRGLYETKDAARLLLFKPGLAAAIRL
jgi:hypothetical protein